MRGDDRSDMTDSIAPFVLDDSLEELFQCLLILVFFDTAREGNLISIREVAPDKHLAVVEQVVELFFVLFNGLVGTDNLLVVPTLIQVGIALGSHVTGCHEVVLQFVVVVYNGSYLELDILIDIPVGIVHVLTYVEVIMALWIELSFHQGYSKEVCIGEEL